MKKIITIITAMLLAVSCCGCGKSDSSWSASTPYKNNEETSAATEKQTQEPEKEPEPDPFVLKEPDSYIVKNKEDFDSLIACLADMTLYKEAESDSESDPKIEIDYEIADKYSIKVDLPSSAIFVDGIELILPLRPKKSETNGLELIMNDSVKTLVAPFMSSYIGARTPNGHILVFEAQNKNSDVFAPLRSRKFTDMLYRTVSVAIDETDPVSHTAFGLDITADTTPYDIVKHFGTPTYIEMYEDCNYSLSYELLSKECGFYFNGSDGILKRVFYYDQLTADIDDSEITNHSFNSSVRIGDGDIYLPTTLEEIKNEGFGNFAARITNNNEADSSELVPPEKLKPLKPGETAVLYCSYNKNVCVITAENTSHTELNFDEIEFDTIYIYPDSSVAKFNFLGITADTATPDKIKEVLGEQDYLDTISDADWIYLCYYGTNGEELTVCVGKETSSVECIIFTRPTDYRLYG